MRKILFLIFNRVGIGTAGRFSNEWSTRTILRTMFSLTISFLRGARKRIFFGTAEGLLLLIGRNVTIRHSRYLHVGRNFIAEDNCELNCLSRRGLHFGNKVIIGSSARIRPTSFYGGELGEKLHTENNYNIIQQSFINFSNLIEIESK
jgi:hypothetical protein